jgi:hypothetical protein
MDKFRAEPAAGDAKAALTPPRPRPGGRGGEAEEEGEVMGAANELASVRASSR